MINKFLKIIIIIIFGIILYAIAISQIKNEVNILDKEKTELEENFKILKNENNSILDKIGTLSSIQNLNKIAEEKNLKKPTKEQIIELTNDKLKTK